MTTLLKNDSFSWNEETDIAFQNLKSAMSNPPVSALPNFDKTFVVECNATGRGVGAVLMQERKGECGDYCFDQVGGGWSSQEDVLCMISFPTPD